MKRVAWTVPKEVSPTYLHLISNSSLKLFSLSNIPINLFAVFNLSTTEAVGIGAGAIAGIVIAGVAVAAAVTAGSKKTYDLWKSRIGESQVIEDNPLYEGSNLDVNNPLYEMKPM